MSSSGIPGFFCFDLTLIIIDSPIRLLLLLSRTDFYEICWDLLALVPYSSYSASCCVSGTPVTLPGIIGVQYSYAHLMLFFFSQALLLVLMNVFSTGTLPPDNYRF